MNNKKKIYLMLSIIIVVVIFGILVVVLVNNKNKDDKKNNNDGQFSNEISNKNDGVISDKSVSGVLFTNIEYTYYNDETRILFDITNNNEEDIKLSHFVINVYNVDNELIGSFHPVCSRVLKSSDTLSAFEVVVEEDLKDAYLIEIELPELELIKE